MRRIAVLAAALTLAAGPAFAHAGLHAESGLWAGFAHPFSGLDHLLAMLAVGLWAGLAAPRRPWLWPAAFLVFMLAGFLAGAEGYGFGAGEALITTSVIGLGLAVATRWNAPTAIGCAIISVFALAHGYAHGGEAPQGASGSAFAVGFVAASALLHGVGLSVARLAQGDRMKPFVRVGGLGVACAGLALAWAG